MSPAMVGLAPVALQARLPGRGRTAALCARPILAPRGPAARQLCARGHARCPADTATRQLCARGRTRRPASPAVGCGHSFAPAIGPGPSTSAAGHSAIPTGPTPTGRALPGETRSQPRGPSPATPQTGAFTPKSTSAVSTVPAVRPGAVWYFQYRFVCAMTCPGGGAP